MYKNQHCTNLYLIYNITPEDKRAYVLYVSSKINLYLFKLLLHNLCPGNIISVLPLTSTSPWLEVKPLFTGCDQFNTTAIFLGFILRRLSEVKMIQEK